MSLARLLAVLHDCAKKYTARTNRNEEISFLGHEKVSAFIAVNWLRAWWKKGLLGDLSNDDLMVIVAVIYGHMLPKRNWHKLDNGTTPYDKFCEELFLFFRDAQKPDQLVSNTLELIETFAVCDVGIDAPFADKDSKMIERGKKIIFS